MHLFHGVLLCAQSLNAGLLSGLSVGVNGFCLLKWVGLFASPILVLLVLVLQEGNLWCATFLPNTFEGKTLAFCERMGLMLPL